MKEAIFIAHRLPFPPNKGEKLRAYHFLKFLTARYPTHLICHVDEERDLEAVRHIDLPLASLHYHFASRKARKRRCVRALLTGASLTVAYFYDHCLQEALNGLLRRRPVAFVFCSCAPAAEYVFRAGFSGRRMMDFMDVDSEKWRAFAQRTAPPMSWVYAEEARRHRFYERRVARAFDRVFLVTEAEAKLFREKVGDFGNVSVIENGVDLQKFHPDYQSPLAKQGPTLVFTGAMDYWPNAEGVQWFVKEVLPLVRNEVPEVRFFIVGKDPLPEVKRLAREPGVEVTGYVDDARDYLALADVSVVPLRLARGVQNKILEAMAMGISVVATQTAAEGLRARPGEHLLVGDSPQTLAQAVVRLLQDRSLAEKIAKAARLAVEKNYSWEKNLARLEEFLP